MNSYGRLTRHSESANERVRSRSLEFRESVVAQASVLLADDNRPVLQHVSKMLESATAYRVVAAVSDGTAVVRECLSRRPDIVVLDISMGDTSGIDVATQLRDEGCPSKIVFLTVHH